MTVQERLEQWEKFDKQVRHHIAQYCQEQYGNDAGNEQVDQFSVSDCWTAIQRYYNRRNARVRGNREALRDLLKVAHYAQFAYDRLKAEMGEGDVCD